MAEAAVPRWRRRWRWCWQMIDYAEDEDEEGFCRDRGTGRGGLDALAGGIVVVGDEERRQMRQTLYSPTKPSCEGEGSSHMPFWETFRPNQEVVRASSDSFCKLQGQPAFAPKEQIHTTLAKHIYRFHASED